MPGEFNAPAPVPDDPSRDTSRGAPRQRRGGPRHLHHRHHLTEADLPAADRRRPVRRHRRLLDLVPGQAGRPGAGVGGGGDTSEGDLVLDAARETGEFGERGLTVDACGREHGGVGDLDTARSGAGLGGAWLVGASARPATAPSENSLAPPSS